jgi:hypothetical protein
MQGEFKVRGGIGCGAKCGAVYAERMLVAHLSPSAKKGLALCKADIARREREDAAQREREAAQREREAALAAQQALASQALAYEVPAAVSRHCKHIDEHIMNLHCPTCDPPLLPLSLFAFRGAPLAGLRFPRRALACRSRGFRRLLRLLCPDVHAVQMLLLRSLFLVRQEE